MEKNESDCGARWSKKIEMAKVGKAARARLHVWALCAHALGTAVLRELVAGEAGVVAGPVRGSGAPSGSLGWRCNLSVPRTCSFKPAHRIHKDIPFGGGTAVGGTAAQLSDAPPSVQLVQSGPGGRARWLLQRRLARLVDLGLARHPRKDLDVCSKKRRAETLPRIEERIGR